MTNLILHLGAHKTGTTTIQRALYESRARLKESGYVYPILNEVRRWESHHSLQALVKPHHKIAPFWRDNRGPMGLMQSTVSNFREILKNTDSHTMVLSSEILANGKYFYYLAYWLRKEFSDIKPIFYLRENASHYRAFLQQSLKVGVFPKQPRFFDAKLDRIRLLLGVDVEVRPYIERLDDPNWNLLDDFWEYGLGLPLDTLVRPDRDLNFADPAELSLILALTTKYYTVPKDNFFKQGMLASDLRLTSFGWLRNELLSKIRNQNIATRRFDFSAKTKAKIKRIADQMSKIHSHNPQALRSRQDFGHFKELDVFQNVDEMTADVSWDKDLSIYLLSAVQEKVKRELTTSSDVSLFRSLERPIDFALQELYSK